MSDTGDKSKIEGRRGPIPRTNRPRPDAARRRRTGGAGSATAPASAATPGTEDEASGPASEPAPSRPVTPLPRTVREPTPAEPAVAPITGVHSAPDTTPVPRSVVGRPEDQNSVMVERPTQLAAGDPVTARDADTRTDLSGGMRPVPLVRADGSRPREDAGPSSTYVGCIIDGRYRVDGVLGRGGMGVVYRARHEVIDKLVAIKILLSTEDRDVVERFMIEAKAATSIGNAHIVDTVDFGMLPDGSTYFVMEYLEGQTLSRRIKRDGFVEVGRAMEIARQIAEGMSAAHRAGIVHRDLKPDNIFLTTRDGEEDFVKLLDFGIAKMQNAQNRLTRAGTIFGTPHYMSPEQAAGAEVDARSDVYSLGVILYEMLSGRPTFEAENPMGLLTQHLYTEPTPLTKLEGVQQEIPSALDAVVLKSLAKKASDRYESMSAFSEDLERVVRGEPPTAIADLLARAQRENDRALIAAAREGSRRRSSRGGRRWIVGLTALLVVGAASAVLIRRPRPPAPAPSTSRPALASPPARAPAKRAVALVFSPIDGEVFQGSKSLGGMPVNVAIAPGEVVEVEIRRDGFFAERVTLDGSKPVVVVRLTPIPGVQPSVPVPSAEPLDHLRQVREREPEQAAAITPLSAKRSDGGVAALPVAPPAEAVVPTPVVQTPDPAASAPPAPQPAAPVEQPSAPAPAEPAPAPPAPAPTAEPTTPPPAADPAPPAAPPPQGQNPPPPPEP